MAGRSTLTVICIVADVSFFLASSLFNAPCSFFVSCSDFSDLVPIYIPPTVGPEESVLFVTFTRDVGFRLCVTFLLKVCTDILIV